MILLKLLLTSFLIISLALIAKKLSSRLAGLLSALPTGTALMLFFYGLEHGPQYVDKVSNYNILGLSASLAFIMFYFIGSNLFKSPIKSLISAIILSLSSYLLIAFSLSLIPNVSTLLASSILFLSVIITGFVFRKIPDTAVKTSNNTKTSILVFRSLIASGFIICLSFAPLYFPDSLAGVVSSFPSVVAPLLIIIHFSFGKESLNEAIKVMPLSYISVLIYSLSVGKSYLYFGVYAGTLASFSLALVYIVFLQVTLKYLASKKGIAVSPQ